ncbi:hypothetical protein Tco_0060650 [Tanacetum coccineum]
MIILPQMWSQTLDERRTYDLYALNREVRRLKKQTISQAKQIHKLKVKLKKLSKGVEPVVKHHAFWVQSQDLKKRRKKQIRKQRKKVSSVKLGRNKDEEAAVTHEFERKSDETEALERKSDETEALERKSDETEQVAIEEEKDASNVKSGDTEESDWKRFQSTARQSAVTPRTLNFEDEAGLSIPGPMQSQPQQPTQATDLKEKGKGILVEEPKKKKLTLFNKSELWEPKNYKEVASKDSSRNGMHKKRRKRRSATIMKRLLEECTKNWEIVRWRLNESSRVHTLELEDGTMIHMLTERRYPLSRELMIRMLDHGMEVEEESDIAITLIHLFIPWTTDDGDDS